METQKKSKNWWFLARKFKHLELKSIKNWLIWRFLARKFKFLRFEKFLKLMIFGVRLNLSYDWNTKLHRWFSKIMFGRSNLPTFIWMALFFRSQYVIYWCRRFFLNLPALSNVGSILWLNGDASINRAFHELERLVI